MSVEQFDLFGPGDSANAFRPTPLPGQAPASKYGLFLALRPRAADAARLKAPIDELRTVHGSSTAIAVLPASWHVSLLGIASFKETYPESQMEAIGLACEGVVSNPSIAVVHDRLSHFKPSGACVLSCSSQANDAIRHLVARTAAALKRFGVRSQKGGWAHLTIFYDRRHEIADLPLQPSLSWSASEISLVVSHVGSNHHEIWRSWALGQ